MYFLPGGAKGEGIENIRFPERGGGFRYDKIPFQKGRAVQRRTKERLPAPSEATETPHEKEQTFTEGKASRNTTGETKYAVINQRRKESDSLPPQYLQSREEKTTKWPWFFLQGGATAPTAVVASNRIPHKEKNRKIIRDTVQRSSGALWCKWQGQAILTQTRRRTLKRLRYRC